MSIPTNRVPEGVAVCPECGGVLYLIYTERYGGMDPSCAAEVVEGKISVSCRKDGIGRRHGKDVGGHRHTYDPAVWRETVEKIKSQEAEELLKSWGFRPVYDETQDQQT